MFLFARTSLNVSVGETGTDELKFCNEVFGFMRKLNFCLFSLNFWGLIEKRLHNELANYHHCIIDKFFSFCLFHRHVIKIQKV